MARKKKKDEQDKKFFTKRGEKKTTVLNRVERQARTREDHGRVLDRAWLSKKDGRPVNIDPVPPPILRADVREEAFGNGHGKRRQNKGSEGSKFTKPDHGTRRAKRRTRNAIAKASRRANR